MKKFWITILCLFAIAAVSISAYYSMKYFRFFSPSFEAIANDTFVELKWRQESDAAYYLVCRSTQDFPASPRDGQKVYLGKGIKLCGVESDRNLDNGQIYYYSLFAFDEHHQVIKNFTASAIPTPKVYKNYVQNSDFSQNLAHWSVNQSDKVLVRKSHDTSIGYYIEITPSENTYTSLTQRISNLKPKTLYTLIVECIGSSPACPPTFSINGPIQKQQQLRNLTPPPENAPEFGYGPITSSSLEPENVNKWQRKGFVFYTGAEQSKSKRNFEGFIDLALIAPKSSDVNAHVGFARVQIIEGIAPYFHPEKILPMVGENLILNPTFKGKPPKNWSLENVTIVNERTNPKTKVSSLKLNPSETTTSYAEQISPFELALGGTYEFSCLSKVDSGKIAYVYIYDKYTEKLLSSIEISDELSDGKWHTISKTFRAPISDRVLPLFVFSAFKEQQDGWHASFARPKLLAIGGESLPFSHPIPKIQLKQKVWTFEKGQLDSNDWLILNQKGSYPNNISFTTIPGNDGRPTQVLQLTGYGNKADESRQLTGAIIMTRDYFTSGRYDVFAKIGDVYDKNSVRDPQFKNIGPIGCSFAIWPYSQINYQKTHNPRLLDQPSPIRNSEIDIEIPADVPKKAGNFSFSHGRLNTWGGQRGGEGNNVELHRKMPKNIHPIDGQFHQFTIVWHAGAEKENEYERTPGFIRWYVDTGDTLKEEHLWAEWKGSTYGFDNIPYRCSRLYLGCWFPLGSYSQSGVWTPGWAGTPDWFSANFYIEKVVYTPLTKKMLGGYPLPNRDRYVPETNPTHFWHEASYQR